MYMYICAVGAGAPGACCSNRRLKCTIRCTISIMYPYCWCYSSQWSYFWWSAPSACTHDDTTPEAFIGVATVNLRRWANNAKHAVHVQYVLMMLQHPVHATLMLQHPEHSLSTFLYNATSLGLYIYQVFSPLMLRHLPGACTHSTYYTKLQP